MLVYHGGTEIIEIPDLTKGRNRLDFGKGFYVTTLKEQAEMWAKRKAKDSKVLGNTSPAIVSVFEFDLQPKLLHKVFDGYSEEWLMFVVHNRRTDIPISRHEYDVVFGNIADDNAARTVDEFIKVFTQGRMSNVILQATLETLSWQEANNQYSFNTVRSLDCLQFIESYEVNS